MLISSAIFGFVKLKEVQSRDVAYNAEQLRTLEYKTLTGDEEYADANHYVKFAPFFAEDYKDDEYSEKRLGACNEIGKTETMYIQVGVEQEGHLENGVITINSKNFMYRTQMLKNSILKNNCVSGNLKRVELNKMTPGNTILIMGDIYANITSEGDYSRENEITLTGTWVPDDTSKESVEINKTINLTVDWYGTADASIYAPYTSINLTDFRTSSNKTIEFDFTINETKLQLLPKQNVVDVTVPQMFGEYPEDVTCKNQWVTATYDKTTHKLHIVRQNKANTSTYTVVMQYSQEAYDQLYNGYTMSAEIEGYYECYNNKNKQFNNDEFEGQTGDEPGIFKTKPVKTTKGISFYTYNAVIADYNFSTRIDNKSYITEPTKGWALSKENLINAYDESKAIGKMDYTVMWSVTKSKKETTTNDGIIMKEIEQEGGYGDTWSGRRMSDYVKNTKIYFSNSNFIPGTGYVKVYDNDTDTLIKEFTYEELTQYSSPEKSYEYDAPITHIRIETSEGNPQTNASLRVYSIKEVNLEAVKEKISKEEMAKIEVIKTDLNGQLTSGASVTGSDECMLAVEKSYAEINVSGKQLSATATEPIEETISINVPNKTVSTANWKNGEFLVAFETSSANESESPLSYVELNSVSTNSKDVQISGYELVKKNGKYFIKIVTKNDTEVTGFGIEIKCKVLVNPMVSSSTIRVNLYSYNEYLNIYHYGTKDTYDVNDNEDTNETVGLSTDTINVMSLNTFMTVETLSEYNRAGEVTIAPNIAEVEKESSENVTENGKATAKVNVSLINNYDKGEVNNVVIIGKIPFQDNTYVDSDTKLGSKFTTTLMGEIELPEAMSKELKEATKIYYSEQDNPKIENSKAENPEDEKNTTGGKVIDSITDEWIKQHGFKEYKEYENETDLSKIKSYLIVIENGQNLARSKTYTFSYKIAIPDDAGINDVSYSCHKVWYDYTSESTRLPMESQPTKLGLRIVKYYDFEVEKIKENTEHAVQGAKFKLTEINTETNVNDNTDEDVSKDNETTQSNSENIKEVSRIITSNAGGKLSLTNLRVNQPYSFQEIQAPEAYELNDKIIRFKVIENKDMTEGDNNTYKVVFLGENNEEIKDDQSEEKEIAKFDGKVTIDQNEQGRYVLKSKITNKPKFELNITKTEKDSEKTLPGVVFTINGESIVTNSEGKATIKNLSLNTEYTLKETYSKGYYPLKEIKFKIKEEKGTTTGEGADGGQGVKYSMVYIDDNNSEQNAESTTDEEGKFSKIEIQNKEENNLIQVNVSLTNEQIPTFNLKIKKVDEANNETTLSGATFYLERKDQQNSEFFTTGEDGTVSITDLYAKVEGKGSITGKYTLKETGSPAGYLNNREEINFVVTKLATTVEATEPQEQEETDGGTNEDNAKYELKLIKGTTDEEEPKQEGKEDTELSINDFDTISDIQTEGNTITITIQDKPLFKLTKIDKETNKPLANADFVIYELNEDGTIKDMAKDANGNYIGTLQENGKYTVTTNAQGVITLALGPGNYKAIETGFPEGYEEELHSEVFTISGGKEKEESQIVEPETEEIEVPVSTKETEKTIEIEKIEDLLDFAYTVNSGERLEDTTVKLTANLDFEDLQSYRNPNDKYKPKNIKSKDGEELQIEGIEEQDGAIDINGDGECESVKEELTKESAKGFPSIGSLKEGEGLNTYIYKPFSGIFDGQGHTISNLYINDSANGSYKGLFGYIDSAEIKNVTVTGEITGKRYVGGICGAASGKVYLKNLNNECKINIAADYTGGIIGGAGAIGTEYSSNPKSIEVLSIKSCTNNGTMIISNGNYSCIGGIIGVINNGYYGEYNKIVSIEKCKNTSNIDSKGYTIAGICGYIRKVEKVKIEDVENSGNMTGSGSTSGIIGYIDAGTRLLNISNANNSGSITGNNQTGGIIGDLDESTCVNILNTTNTGNVSGGDDIGGLIGYEKVTDYIKIMNCSNEGSITAISDIGGLVGYATNGNGNIYIIQSCNTGDINYSNNSSDRGGLIGSFYSSSSSIFIKSSYNKGNIIGPDNGKSRSNGGLIGQSTSNQLRIEQSYNTGKIDKGGYVGGLIGASYVGPTSIYKCYNSGTIEVGGNYNYTGGLIGEKENSVNIQDSDNLGNIVQMENGELYDPHIGGIIGSLRSSSSYNIVNCSNKGNITVRNAKSVEFGGLIGYGGNSGTIKGSSNSGDITVKDAQSTNHIGGLLGIGLGSIQTCDNSGDITVNGKEDSQGYSYTGGIVGYSSSGMNVSNAYNTGDLSFSSSHRGIYAGGILGNSSSSSIQSCYNEGDIKCNGSVSSSLYEGGIAGYNSALIQNCYNTGEINNSHGSSSQGDISTYIGGIVGSGNAVVNCYNIASVCDDISCCSTSSDNHVGPIYGKSGNSGTNYYEEDIDVVGKVQGSRNYCTAYSEKYMKSEEFFNILKGKSTIWIHEENQYPTLDIAVLNNSSEVTELTIGNNKETFDITTQIGEDASGSRDGGTITGDYTAKYIEQNNIKLVETVKYGEKSTQDIKIEPNDNSNYMIQKITINGEEIGFTIDEEGKYTLPKGYFENVTEDINIVAYFAQKGKTITINKIDKENNKLAGAVFKVESESLTGDKVLEKPVENGKHYFIKDDSNKLVPNNKGYNGTTANSYYEIDLRGTTGDSIVEVEAELQSGAGCLYGMITESPNVPEYDEKEAFIYETTGFNSTKTFTTEPLVGGKLYYMHLGYMCTNANSNSCQVSINDITIVTTGEKIDADVENSEETEETSYHFDKKDNGYVPNNLETTGTEAVSYIPINLEKEAGKCSISVKVNSKNSGELCGYITDEKKVPEDDTQLFFKTSNQGEETIYSPLFEGGSEKYLCLQFTSAEEEDINPVVVEDIRIATEETFLTGETDENGQLILEVPDGTYTITEVKAPEGYSLSTEPKTCIVSSESYSEDGAENTVTVTDDKLKEVVIHYYLKDSNKDNKNYGAIPTTQSTSGTTSGATSEATSEASSEASTETLSKTSSIVVENKSVLQKAKNYINNALESDNMINKIIQQRNNQPISLKDDVHLYGNFGEDYDTSEYIETELQGYTLEVDENNEYVIPGNATGTFDDEVIHVKYYYEKTTTQLTNLSITKKWNLPEDIVNDYRATLKLMKVVNGKTTPVIDANGDEVTRTIRGNGTELLENLPKYEEGTEIRYTVEEIQVEKLQSINNETQEENWEEVPLSQFKATYEVKEKEKN